MEQHSSNLKMANHWHCTQSKNAFAAAVRTFFQLETANGLPNIFLIQYKGKGPPGRSRGPDL